MDVLVNHMWVYLLQASHQALCKCMIYIDSRGRREKGGEGRRKGGGGKGERERGRGKGGRGGGKGRGKGGGGKGRGRGKGEREGKRGRGKWGWGGRREERASLPSNVPIIATIVNPCLLSNPNLFHLPPCIK